MQGGGGGAYNPCGTQSLSHALPRSSEALWPGPVSSLLSAWLPGLFCLLGSFVVASLDVVLSVRLSSRATCIDQSPPPVSGILSFLFSRLPEPVLQPVVG